MDEAEPISDAGAPSSGDDPAGGKSPGGSARHAGSAAPAVTPPEGTPLGAESVDALDGAAEVADDDDGAGGKDPFVGKTLGDCWIVKRLGEGGFGTVYRAIDKGRGHPVAVKVVKPGRAGSEEVIRKFLRGAIAASRIEHPHVVRIYRIGRDEKAGLPYIVMEHLKGRTLQALIDERGALSPAELFPILIEAAEGLKAAHASGVIHRDVKPDNIMIAEGGPVKITDLGLARTVAPNERTRRVMGTPHFMSPEQFEGRGLDARTDVYSFGVTVYYALSKQFPYAGANSMQIVFSILTSEPRPLAEVRPGLDPAIWDAIQQMIARVPEHRIASMDQVQRVLRTLLERQAP
jgi:serine/threonine protein kinase